MADYVEGEPEHEANARLARPRIADMAFTPPPECPTCHGLGYILAPIHDIIGGDGSPVGHIYAEDERCPDCSLPHGGAIATRGGIPYTPPKDTPMRLPINATTYGPLYHSERLRHPGRALTGSELPQAEFHEQCADLLEQYRGALTDLYVLLLGTRTEPKMAGTVVEQAAWIVAHRGLGIPTTH